VDIKSHNPLRSTLRSYTLRYQRATEIRCTKMEHYKAQHAMRPTIQVYTGACSDLSLIITVMHERR